MSMRSELRQRVWNTTQGLCFYCQRRLLDDGGEGPEIVGKRLFMHMDHVIPRARGGRDAFANLAPACGRCNMEKGDLTADEYRLWLLERHVAPRFFGDSGPERDWILVGSKGIPKSTTIFPPASERRQKHRNLGLR